MTNLNCHVHNIQQKMFVAKQNFNFNKTSLWITIQMLKNHRGEICSQTARCRHYCNGYVRCTREKIFAKDNRIPHNFILFGNHVHYTQQKLFVAKQNFNLNQRCEICSQTACCSNNRYVHYAKTIILLQRTIELLTKLFSSEISQISKKLVVFCI